MGAFAAENSIKELEPGITAGLKFDRFRADAFVLVVLMLSSVYFSCAVMFIASLGVFYAVSRLFLLSGRLRFVLVTAAASITSLHQLIIHWHVELPSLIYYTTAFFTNFCIYALPIGMVVSLFLILKALVRIVLHRSTTPEDNVSDFDYASGPVTTIDVAAPPVSAAAGAAAAGAAAAGAVGNDAAIAASEDRACMMTEDKEQPAKISAAPVEAKRAQSFYSGGRSPVASADAESAAASGAAYYVAGGSPHSGVTVERCMWFTGEEMVITSSDDEAEVSFNGTSGVSKAAACQYGAVGLRAASELHGCGTKAGSNNKKERRVAAAAVGANVPATAYAAVDMAVAVSEATVSPVVEGSSILDGSIKLNQKQQELLAQIQTTIDSKRRRKRDMYCLNTSSGEAATAGSSFGAVSGSDAELSDSTGVYVSLARNNTAAMMGAFAHEHHKLDEKVVRLDKERQMAVIEAEDKTDNTHVLIITSNVPDKVLSVQAQAQSAAPDNGSGAVVLSQQDASDRAFTIAQKAAAAAPADAAGEPTAGVAARDFADLATASEDDGIKAWRRHLSARTVLRFGVQGLVAMVAMVSLYSTFQALAMPEVHEVTVSLDVPEKFDGLDLIQLSDLQDSPIRRKERASYIFNKVAQIRPSLVVITGEFQQSQLSDPDLLPLLRMNVPYGVYAAVTTESNKLQYEYYRLFENLNYSFLSNSAHGVEIGNAHLNIIGITAQDARDGNFSVLQERHIRDSHNNLNILLSNCSRYVDLLSEVSQDSIDLMLVGHTFGGLNPLVKDSIVGLHHGFISGLYHPSNSSMMLLYVSSGSQVPDSTPSRLGSRSEITHITIHSSRIQHAKAHAVPVAVASNFTASSYPTGSAPSAEGINGDMRIVTGQGTVSGRGTLSAHDSSWHNTPEAARIAAAANNGQSIFGAGTAATASTPESAGGTTVAPALPDVATSFAPEVANDSRIKGFEYISESDLFADFTDKAAVDADEDETRIVLTDDGNKVQLRPDSFLKHIIVQDPIAIEDMTFFDQLTARMVYGSSLSEITAGEARTRRRMAQSIDPNCIPFRTAGSAADTEQKPDLEINVGSDEGISVPEAVNRLATDEEPFSC